MDKLRKVHQSARAKAALAIFQAQRLGLPRGPGLHGFGALAYLGSKRA